MELWTSPDTWVALLTLTLLEVVLGIDNIIFISVVSNRLPEHQQPVARRVGLILALVVRVALLAAIAWLIGLSKPLFEVAGHAVSVRDLLLGVGGLFLLAKSTSEIHAKIDGEEDSGHTSKRAGFASIILQIVLLDMVFSLDSMLTAVGMVRELPIMIAAVVLSMVVMLVFASSISRFINNNPTVQILALSFLLLIGVMLVMEAFHQEIPKGYIYFAVAFSLLVELLNMALRKRKQRKQEKASGHST